MVNILITINCHSERSEESREHPRFVLPRSFLPTVVWMTLSGNLYIHNNKKFTTNVETKVVN